MKIYYFVPGKTPYEDISIIDVKNNHALITYKKFKNQHEKSISLLNLNYPSFLIKEGASDGAILSFHVNTETEEIVVGQTMICGQDQEKRSLPITKILTFQQPLKISELYEQLSKGNKEIDYPDYTIKNRTKKSNSIPYGSFKLTRYFSDIKDWNNEQYQAFERSINALLSGKNIISGKSMIFNDVEKNKYESYTFYTAKKKMYSVIIVTLIVLSFLIIGYLIYAANF